MGAPTGSFEVADRDLPARDGAPEALVRVACDREHGGRLRVEPFLIASQVAGSGLQVCAAACSGVSFGSSLVFPTARASISPISIGSPRDVARSDGAASWPKLTSIVQKRARGLASRHSSRGGGNSGGKTEPSSG